MSAAERRARGEADRDDGPHRAERAAAHRGGNDAVTTAGPIAIIALAPSACRTRAATSAPSPGASPQSAEPSVKRRRPAA